MGEISAQRATPRSGGRILASLPCRGPSGQLLCNVLKSPAPGTVILSATLLLRAHSWPLHYIWRTVRPQQYLAHIMSLWDSEHLLLLSLRSPCMTWGGILGHSIEPNRREQGLSGVILLQTVCLMHQCQLMLTRSAMLQSLEQEAYSYWVWADYTPIFTRCCGWLRVGDLGEWVISVLAHKAGISDASSIFHLAPPFT